MVRLWPFLAMYSDAADVGYGATLDLAETAWSQGLGRVKVSVTGKTTCNRLLSGSCARSGCYRIGTLANSRPTLAVQAILVDEENQQVVHVLNAMVSKSWPIMEEQRKLERLLKVMGVSLEARAIPSAMNLFADALTRI